MRTRPRSGLVRLLAVIITGGIHAAGFGSWSYVVLHVAGYSPSFALGVGGGQQVGHGGNFKAVIWSGSAGSLVDITASGTHNNRVHHTNGVRQVGTVQLDPLGDRASLWSGTSASWIDLTPPGASRSGAHAIHGDQQVGYATIGGQDVAALWTGSAASFVNLNPSPGIAHSRAYGVHGGQQVGSVVFLSGPTHASLWSGSAASWVDIHPTSVTSIESVAVATQGGQQVGYTVVGGNTHASLWSGTSASFVDLHPDGAIRSEATGVWGGRQCGWIINSFGRRAVVWEGSAASETNLSAVLDPNYYDAYASGIWQDANHTYVAGFASHLLFGTNHAILWIGPPGTTLTGFVNFEGLSDRAYQPNPVTLEFRQGGSLVGSRTVALGANGEFATTPPQSGMLDVSVFEGTWLRKTVAVDTSGGPTNATFDLLNGDCDHDNEVTIGDYALLSLAFNSFPGEPDWNPDADLNRDEGVDIGDFALLSGNFGEVGD